MQQLYQTLDSGHVGLFESPTGTGKSLSLICAGLYWLKERQRKDDAGEDDPVAASSSSSSTSTTTNNNTKAAAAEPDWLRDYGKDKERAAAAEKREKVRERRQALHLRLEEARQASHRLSALRPEGRQRGNDDARAQHNKKRFGSGGGGKADGKDTEDKEDEEDADLLPAEYESGKESDDDSDDDATSAGFKGKDKKEEEEGEELDRSTIKVGVRLRKRWAGGWAVWALFFHRLYTQGSSSHHCFTRTPQHRFCTAAGRTLKFPSL